MQRKTNNKFSCGDCDMLVSGPLLNTLYFYFRHFLSAYWLISPGGGGLMDSYMKQTGMLVVLLRGVNFGFMLMPHPDGLL